MNRGSPEGPLQRNALGRLASMRPRFMNRGSVADRLHALERQQASMRPRFMNRGSETILATLTAG